MSRILAHWGLSVDPFRPMNGPWVSTSAQDEAVARIRFALAEGHRRIVLTAEAGAGKTVVLSRLAELLRWPTRLVKTIGAGDDLEFTFSGRSGWGASRPPASRLSTSLRGLGLEGKTVVLLVDDAHRLTPDRRDLLEGLIATDRAGKVSVQAVEFGRGDPASAEESWDLAIRLGRLTRGETADYLGKKLSSAHRAEGIFRPRAIDRLHALSGGLPRAVDRLASLAMIAGAVQDAEGISAEMVDAVGGEVVLPAEV